MPALAASPACSDLRLNSTYPLYAAVRSIVEKTIGVRALLTQALGGVERIEEAYLVGSFARNQQDTSSNIDVLPIGSPKAEEVAQVIAKLERHLGREINYVGSRARILSRGASMGTHFWRTSGATAFRS